MLANASAVQMGFTSCSSRRVGVKQVREKSHIVHADSKSLVDWSDHGKLFPFPL